MLLHSWFSEKALQTRCPSIISYNFIFQVFSSIFSCSASRVLMMIRALEDHVYPVKNLRQDCHGRKPPAEGGKNCQSFVTFSTCTPSGARSEFVIPKLKWHGSITYHTLGMEHNNLSSLQDQSLHRLRISFVRSEQSGKKRSWIKDSNVIKCTAALMELTEVQLPKSVRKSSKKRLTANFGRQWLCNFCLRIKKN